MSTRKLTREQALAEVTRLQASETAHMLALQAMVTGAAVPLGVFEHDGWRFRAWIARPCSPCGGLLVTEWKAPKQSPSVHVEYLEAALTDRARTGASGYPHAMLDAAIVARQRALDVEVTP